MVDLTASSATIPDARSEVAPKARRVNRSGAALAMSMPAIVLMFLMLIGPLGAVIALSFTDYQLGAPSLSWIGLANYQEMLDDRVFWIALTNTVVYVAIVVPLAVALGLGVALLIESGSSLRSWYRTIYFLPVMATLIAMSIVWEFMLHPQFGLINALLASVGLEGYSWLQDRRTALYALCAIGIWQALGFNMVLFLAGLMSIPRHLYDAAEIDGMRSGWDKFRLVTWPMLGPTTLFVVIITSIRGFQVFDTVHVLTKGGPSKSTEVLIHRMYVEGFEFFRSGYGAALTIVFLAFVLLLTLIKAQLASRRVHYS
ncbi:carbohydrate ABC transporter permease [Rhodopseudomonas boonkerdii]|uniref:carbohydrate ABC transporter permease n=1 Tax=Rhodopseudomonas boonkerdii TaxID=475937 RepID=UPI001E2E44BF|nr:sugar ABC transporter permease [Rhodopseudomonas boonkerdii]